MTILRLFSFGLLAIVVRQTDALLECPTAVSPNPLGTGYTYKVLSATWDETDQVLGTDLKHVVASATVQNAFDDTMVQCYADGIVNNTGWNMVDFATAAVSGNCNYPSDGPMGAIVMTWELKGWYNGGNMLDFHLDQWWSCRKDGEKRPRNVQAVGNSVVRLSCFATGRKCEADLREPLLIDSGPVFLMYPPAETACAQASLTKPNWELEGFHWTAYPVANGSRGGIIIPYDVKTNGLITLDIYSSNIDLHGECFRNDYGLSPGNGDRWYTQDWLLCNFEAPTPIDAAAPVYIKFNHTTRELAVRQTWACDDTSSGRASFTGIATTGPLALDCHLINNRTDYRECYLAKPVTLHPNISYVPT